MMKIINPIFFLFFLLLNLNAHGLGTYNTRCEQPPSLNFFDTATRVNVSDSAILASVKNGNLSALEEQLSTTKEINRRYGKDGITLLNYSIQNNQPEIVEFLLSLEANIEQKSEYKTPLMFAARYGRLDILILLIENGADINSINRDRNTAFHYAAKYNRLDILKALYSFDAKINIPNEDQWTALDYSIINYKPEIEEYLRSIGCILFDKNLPTYFDGPYIEISGEKSFRADYLVNKPGSKGSYILSKDIDISVDGPNLKGLRKDKNSYTITSNHQPPPSIYKEPSKIFVMGDIHGQFERMTEMLISGGVVNKGLNWTWGDGHLLFVGDILDRGEGVTEALWLIYKLEQQAEKSGGKVHLLLGNHEVMIIKSDIRYIANKYYGLISNLDLKYQDLFSENTVLGNWLRSKNVVEIIGNTMFIHAGISPQLLEENLTIDEINDDFRNLLKTDPANYNTLDKLLIGNYGPVWYRGYLKSGSGYNEIDISGLDSILKQYGATNIVVGHTEVDLIEPIKREMVIPVNIPLADKEIIGQALLIEGEKIYRISTDKTEVLLINRSK